MIKLITGKKGTGKTKILIDAIHEAENKSNGNVVAVQKGSSLNTDITPKVRLVNIDDYAVAGVEGFYGFVSGVLASDYDCTDIFVDATLKITGRDYEKVAEMFEKLAKVSGDTVVTCTNTGSRGLLAPGSFLSKTQYYKPVVPGIADKLDKTQRNFEKFR